MPSITGYSSLAARACSSSRVLDSSFLSFPQAVDILLVILSTRHPEWMPLYVGLSTLGSVGGLALFTVGRKGGELFLRRRFRPTTVDRAMAFYQRFGAGAIAFPAMLPPPTPFKLLTLLAGAAGMQPPDVCVLGHEGRGGALSDRGRTGREYGDRAWAFLSDHSLRWWSGRRRSISESSRTWLLWRRTNAVAADADLVNSQRPQLPKPKAQSQSLKKAQSPKPKAQSPKPKA